MEKVIVEPKELIRIVRVWFSSARATKNTQKSADAKNYEPQI